LTPSIDRLRRDGVTKRTFKNGDEPEGVDAYLASVPRKVRTLLVRRRRAIKAAAPRAQESISYFMPTHKLNGPLVFFAAHHDKRCGFYGVSKSVLKALKKELAPYHTSSTTLHSGSTSHCRKSW
jgi:uncharacterized protein YdhG (YjbR/CyaY superfamily)